MAVLEREDDPEVALKRAADGVACQGTELLAAFGLAGWRGGVVGEGVGSGVQLRPFAACG